MKAFFVFCVIVPLVNCQFGFFNMQNQQQPFSLTKGLSGIRETVRGILRPNRRPVINDVNQNGRPQNYPQNEQNYPQGQNGNSQRPVSFPTAYPEEAPNYGNQGGSQGGPQRPVFQGQDSEPGQGNVNFVNSQGGTQKPVFQGQDGEPVQGNVNFVNSQGGTQAPVFQGQDGEPGQGNVNFVNNAPAQGHGTVNFVNNDGGSYDGPNDAVDFGSQPSTSASSTPEPESRNNFNFNPVPQFRDTCKVTTRGTGSCIVLNSCQPFLVLLQQSRSNPTTVQMLRQAHCGFDGSNPKVCCPLPGLATALPGPVTTTTTTTTSTTTTTTTTPAPSPSVKTIDGDFLASLPAPPVCGVSNTSLSRVVGGVKAKLGAFPWMALLGYRRAEDTRWLCGGSLISSRHVLTAAHCIHNHEKDLYLVRLGELDLARDDEGATPVDVPIKEQIKHEQYSPKAFTNDIALLVLERDVQFTDLIKPICIPMSSELRARSFEDYNPIIAGWGDTEFRGPAATHLQVLQLPVVSNEFCAQAYSAYKSQQIDEKVLCAGYKKGGKDACQGDSGGPLMQPIYNPENLKTHMYQIGVVSFGKKCAEAGFPGVYSRVTYFVPWIQEKTTGVTSR